jgi:hypothetical protein
MELVQYVTQNYPGLGPDFLMQILGGEAADISADREARQAERQAALGGFSDTLLGAATQGAPPETIEALASAYTAANPVLSRPRFSENVGNILSSAQDVAGSLQPQGLDAEDLAIIDETVGTDRQNATPEDAQRIRNGVMDFMRQTGSYTNEQLEQAKDYFDRVWNRAGGPPAPNSSITGYTEPGETAADEIGAGVAAGTVGALLGRRLGRSIVSRFGTGETPGPGLLSQIGSAIRPGSVAAPMTPDANVGVTAATRPPASTAAAPSEIAQSPRALLGREMPALPAVGQTRPNAGALEMPGRIFGTEPAYTEPRPTGGVAEVGRAPLMPRALSGLYGISNFLGLGLDVARGAGLTHSTFGIPNENIAEYQAAQSTGLNVRWNPEGFAEVEIQPGSWIAFRELPSTSTGGIALPG